MFERECPTCKKIIHYKCKRSCEKAIKNGSECKPCCKQGKKNSFYGKKHKNESKIKMASDRSFMQTIEYKKKMSKVMTGRNLGINIYDIWVQSYGKEEADIKLENLKKKRSLNAIGCKNPMYGKPSPHGSGNGWSGWYKDWYFRSIKELSYMINVIEKQKLSWRSAEITDYKIPYLDFNNQLRNYYADFIINEIKLVEIKPVRLHNTPLVMLKKQAAEKFCLKKGMTYELLDIKPVSYEELYILHRKKELVFLKKYEEKFLSKSFS